MTACVGEGADQFDLPLGERFDPLSGEYDHADHGSPSRISGTASRGAGASARIASRCSRIPGRRQRRSMMDDLLSSEDRAR